jgi:hypothetical protein
MTIIEIKAAIYDNIAAMETAKRNIQALEAELRKAQREAKDE